LRLIYIIKYVLEITTILQNLFLRLINN